MGANRVVLKRDRHACAGSLNAVRNWGTVVSRSGGPLCASVPLEVGKLCKAIPICCVAKGLEEVGSVCLRHGGDRENFSEPFLSTKGNFNFLLSTKGREGPRRAAKKVKGNCRRSTATSTSFVHGGPRRATEKVKGNCRKGNCRRSTATAISFFHDGTRRTCLHLLIR